jgi:hypothetical protein
MEVHLEGFVLFQDHMIKVEVFRWMVVFLPAGSSFAVYDVPAEKIQAKLCTVNKPNQILAGFP